MSGVRLGKAARYGLYALVRMAQRPGERVTARDVSTEHHLSEHHVAKVLSTLREAGLIDGARGAGGGYQLARGPGEITMLEVVESLEGPQAATPCAGCEHRAHGDCARSTDACVVHAVLHEIGANAYYTLKSVTIATLVTQALGAEPLALRSAASRSSAAGARATRS